MAFVKAGGASKTPPVPQPFVFVEKDEAPDRHFGTVLVTGGCGFIGHHLVHQLAREQHEKACGPIHVIDKDITRNIFPHPNLFYHQCDITDTAEVEALMNRVRPKVIFHTASPNAIYERRNAFWRGRFYHTNVTATANLLRLSKLPGSSVEVFVYTSSPCVYKTDHRAPVRESAPTHNGRPWPWQGVCEPVWTKGIAHNMVLDENESWKKGGLKTVVIVPGIVYGGGDSQVLPLIFDAFQHPKVPFVKVGGGDNRASFVEATKCAGIHILAARALVAGGKNIAGQAYNATDGTDDVPFWWHIGLTCAAIWAMDEADTSRAKFRTVPPWVMLVAVHFVWWMCLIFTLGYVEPPLALSVEGYKWATKDRLLNIQSAVRLLGYVPGSVTKWHEDTVKAAVEHERELRRLARVRSPEATRQGDREPGDQQTHAHAD